MADGENKKQSGFTGITRDLTMMALGATIGAAITVGAGFATNSIRTPEEREAANKAIAAKK